MSEHIDTRVTVMETIFNEFQKSIVNHMKHEERAFDRLHDDIKTVIERLDDTSNNIIASSDNLKTKLTLATKNEYVDKIEFEKYKLTIINNIKDSQRETFSRLTWLGSTIMSIITFAGWFYIESHKLGVQ